MQKCGPAPNVSDFAAPRSAVMSKRSGPRRPRPRGSRSTPRRTRPSPWGTSMSRNSTSSSITRVVKGATGSKRRTSSAACGASEVSAPSSAHWSGWSGEQPHPVCERALRGVDTAVQRVAHQRHALLVGQAVALLLGGDHRGHQIVARDSSGARRPAAARKRRTRRPPAPAPRGASSGRSRRTGSGAGSTAGAARPHPRAARPPPSRSCAPDRAWRSRSRSHSARGSATSSHRSARNSRMAGRYRSAAFGVK